MMKIVFTLGYTYRFTRFDGNHADYVLAGMGDGDSKWRDATGALHPSATVFRDVAEIYEIARPPRAENEL